MTFSPHRFPSQIAHIAFSHEEIDDGEPCRFRNSLSKDVLRRCKKKAKERIPDCGEGRA